MAAIKDTTGNRFDIYRHEVSHAVANAIACVRGGLSEPDYAEVNLHIEIGPAAGEVRFAYPAKLSKGYVAKVEAIAALAPAIIHPMAGSLLASKSINTLIDKSQMSDEDITQYRKAPVSFMEALPVLLATAEFWEKLGAKGEIKLFRLMTDKRLDHVDLTLDKLLPYRVAKQLADDADRLAKSFYENNRGAA